MSAKGVLFDFDGTLTSPGALDFPAIKRQLGCPVDQPILEYLETQPPNSRVELVKILEDSEEHAAEASRPNQGAERCLFALKKRGIPLGILTRNSLSSVKTALQNFKDVTIHEILPQLSLAIFLCPSLTLTVCIRPQNRWVFYQRSYWWWVIFVST